MKGEGSGEFKGLWDDGERLKEEFETFDVNSESYFNDDDVNSKRVNEYGEIVDDEDIDLSSDELNEEGGNTYTNQTTCLSNEDEIALPVAPTTHTKNSKSWSKRSQFAPNETDKEFELFKIFCREGGGRSIQYISAVSHLSPNTINKVAVKNSWQRRSADYDRAKLIQRQQEAQNARHEEHLRKLEAYREEQEALGQQITQNAARIALLANASLAKMLDQEQVIGIKDLPSMLQAAAKLADVGKNLQSSALGVDNLLAAIEESED